VERDALAVAVVALSLQHLVIASIDCHVVDGSLRSVEDQISGLTLLIRILGGSIPLHGGTVSHRDANTLVESIKSKSTAVKSLNLAVIAVGRLGLNGSVGGSVLVAATPGIRPALVHLLLGIVHDRLAAAGSGGIAALTACKAAGSRAHTGLHRASAGRGLLAGSLVAVALDVSAAGDLRATRALAVNRSARAGALGHAETVVVVADDVGAALDVGGSVVAVSCSALATKAGAVAGADAHTTALAGAAWVTHLSKGKSDQKRNNKNSSHDNGKKRVKNKQC